MEEILSSIRRIIADEEADDSGADQDEDLGAAEVHAETLDENAEALARAADDEDGDEDVLELTKVVRESGEVVELPSERSSADPVTEETAPAIARDEGDHESALADGEPSDGSRNDPDGKDEPVQTEQARTTGATPALAATEVMSASAATVATGAFAKLSHALQRTPEEASIADNSGRTVEQFVEDIARPMLKDWMDEHLPAIVERLVEKEIQKISRRAELM
jgi:cell pole-organizing protein PopZ